MIAGHNKPITRMIKGHDDSNPTLITAGSDGRVVEWSVADGSTRTMQVCYLFNMFLPVYRTRGIISRGLYIFTPFFTAVYNYEWLILETIYVVNKEIRGL